MRNLKAYKFVNAREFGITDWRLKFCCAENFQEAKEIFGRRCGQYGCFHVPLLNSIRMKQITYVDYKLYKTNPCGFFAELINHGWLIRCETCGKPIIKPKHLGGINDMGICCKDCEDITQADILPYLEGIFWDD